MSFEVDGETITIMSDFVKGRPNGQIKLGTGKGAPTIESPWVDGVLQGGASSGATAGAVGILSF